MSKLLCSVMLAASVARANAQTPAPHPPPAPQTGARGGITPAPRPDAPTAPRAPTAAPTPRMLHVPPPRPPVPASPTGWFGFSIRCSECLWSRNGSEPTPHWEFTLPPEIVIVAEGGPGARAGFLPGDRITHIDGISIVQAEGGRKFTALKPGQRVRLTVTRDGVPMTRDLTLTQRPGARGGSTRSALRYTGRLSDVDIEVWGPTGATVERDGDVITINIGTSTIRLMSVTPGERE